MLCQGKDVFERMNYLYQASQNIVSKDVYLSSFYGDMLTKCSKRAVLRLGTDVKRSMCKMCQSPLIPGQTVRVRLISKPVKCVKWHCLICNDIKKYPVSKNYKLWSDNSESVIQEYNYGTKSKHKSDNNKMDSKTKEKNIPHKILEENENQKLETTNM